jgi:hypothetical protein
MKKKKYEYEYKDKYNNGVWRPVMSEVQSIQQAIAWYLYVSDLSGCSYDGTRMEATFREVGSKGEYHWSIMDRELPHEVPNEVPQNRKWGKWNPPTKKVGEEIHVKFAGKWIPLSSFSEHDSIGRYSYTPVESGVSLVLEHADGEIRIARK